MRVTNEIQGYNEGSPICRRGQYSLVLFILEGQGVCDMFPALDSLERISFSNEIL